MWLASENTLSSTLTSSLSPITNNFQPAAVSGTPHLSKTQQTPGLFNMQEWELTLSLRQVVCNLLVEIKIFH